MKKLWLLVATQQLEPRLVGGRGLDEPRRSAVQPEARPRGLEHETDIKILCRSFNSLIELEEQADLLLRQNSTIKFMVFEAISVLEIIPSAPIRKQFNENGELLV